MRRLGAESRAVAACAVLIVLVACDDGDDITEGSLSDEVTESAASAGCGGGEGTGGHHELTHDGLAREYVVHLPEDYENQSPAPLALNLHLLGSDAERHDAETDLPELAGERGYIVVTPQGEELLDGRGRGLTAFEGLRFWNVFATPVDPRDEGVGAAEDPQSDEIGADDLGFLTSLLDHLLDDYCVDVDRVFSAGMSNGAGMTTVLGCELDSRLAAIGPVAGVNLARDCPGSQPVAVVAVHGDADDVVAYDGDFLFGFPLGNPSVPERMDAWAARNGCDPVPIIEDDRESVVVTTWEGCHDGAEVELWTMGGWGHMWPRGADETGPGSVDATTTILDFFDRVTAG